MEDLESEGVHTADSLKRLLLSAARMSQVASYESALTDRLKFKAQIVFCFYAWLIDVVWIHVGLFFFK